jgi:dynactin complex subunit
VATDKFDPHIGDKVRMQSMGMEGILRFLGTTEFRDGIWAGVELEGGFAGKGKNDGSVEGYVQAIQ